MQLSWKQKEERLEVKGHADIRKDANFTDCYFDEYSSADLLCVEAQHHVPSAGVALRTDRLFPSAVLKP